VNKDVKYLLNKLTISGGLSAAVLDGGSTRLAAVSEADFVEILFSIF
jgi:hypothetical protein